MYEVIRADGVIVAFVEASNFVEAEALAIEELHVSANDFDAQFHIEKV
nr:MAG TPA: hypothetical protein [Caudoviricetes sp.]